MSGRILVGLILLVLGIGFLVGEFTDTDFGSIIGTYWPLIIVAVGLIQLVSGGGTILGSLILVFAGGVLQLWTLDALSVDFWGLIWPIALIVVGLALLVPRLNRGLRGGGRGAADDDNRVEYTTFFGGLEREIRAPAFEGGELTAAFGGMELDLRGTTLSPTGARLDATVFMGGLELHVPDDWRVDISGTPILGGWDSKPPAPSADTPPDKVLRIKAFTMFGGLDVK